MLGRFDGSRPRLSALVCVWLVACTASAQWRAYVLLPDGATASYAGGVAGDVAVGYAVFGGVPKPVAWIGTNGTYVLLDSPGEGYATGIEGNVIAGAVKVGNAFHAVIWPTPFSKYIDLNGTSAASGLSGIGGAQQVGYSELGPTLWTGSAGSAVSLTPPGSTIAEVYGTDGVQQAGLAYFDGQPHAILWSGTASSFVDLTGANLYSARAYDVDAGTQVGQAAVQYGLQINGRAALWRGTADSFVSLDPYVLSQGTAWGVFGGRQVGSLQTSTGQRRAILWRGSSTEWEDLNCYVPDPAFGTDAINMHVEGGVTRIVGRVGAPQNSKAVLWVSEDVVERAPTSHFVAQGTYAIGNIISLRRSDDDWIVVMAPALPNENVEVVFEGSAPAGSFSRMIFAVDGHSREPYIPFQVYLYDFEKGDWSLQESGVFEKDFDFPICVITDPARFMSPGTRRVRSKIVATFPSGESRSLWVDRVRWAFSP